MNEAEKVHCRVYPYESTECIFSCTLKPITPQKHPSANNVKRHTPWNNLFYYIVMFSNTGHHHHDLETFLLLHHFITSGISLILIDNFQDFHAKFSSLHILMDFPDFPTDLAIFVPGGLPLP
jgi:hypothetical protein